MWYNNILSSTRPYNIISRGAAFSLAIIINIILLCIIASHAAAAEYSRVRFRRSDASGAATRPPPPPHGPEQPVYGARRCYAIPRRVHRRFRFDGFFSSHATDAIISLRDQQRKTHNFLRKSHHHKESECVNPSTTVSNRRKESFAGELRFHEDGTRIGSRVKIDDRLPQQRHVINSCNWA